MSKNFPDLTSVCESSQSSEFPKSTSDWNSRFIDKLGVRCKQCDIFEIIVNHWRLFTLFEEDHLEIESCLKACDFETHYGCLEDVPVEKAFAPEFQWKLRSQSQENEILREPLVSKWFLGKLTEINRCLSSIISQTKSDETEQRLKYLVLFEKVLQAFGLMTLSEPFIITHKVQILGRTMTSKPDIVCCQDNWEQRTVCVCQVIKSVTYEGDDFDPPKKKIRVTSNLDEEIIRNGDQVVPSQHIGDLFVHLDKSPISDRILGFIIEKTWVQLTFLKVYPTAMERIRNTPVNIAGSLILNDGECPQLHYSRRYNFLNRQDRKDLFKALLLIKIMIVRRETARKR
ncbi:uncharacterized protein LOC134271500 [Saccostrea cucullata]|uniref:uncharacterized protein LOC134238315 n=1 Tax=Saccostrea cuccullata TaxID=36930 RepID=UPI002ED465E9